MKEEVREIQSFQTPEVRVVQASAGSGKTYTLAKRYVQLLLKEDLSAPSLQLKDILAITFTNKAAIEMKLRILEYLKLIAFGQLPENLENDMLLSVGINPQKAAQRAFYLMDYIISHYNFFQVQTIDKFINALLSGCSFAIGLTANFKIKTNIKDYLEYSLDELIDAASSDRNISNVFENFLFHYMYLENRTGWFPKQDMLSIINDLFAQYNHYGRSFYLSGSDHEDLYKLKHDLLEKMRKLRLMLPEGTNKTFHNSLVKFLDQNEKSFDFDSLSKSFRRDELPVNKGVETPRDVEKLWSSIHQEIKELSERESFSVFNPYIRVFGLVLALFKEITQKDDVVFLEELNKRAGQLFDKDYVTVQELYYRLATRYRHYLIDEFQDTSRLQWHNMEKMIEEALSTGGTLFFVGDQKQAIYSFRGGDAALFNEVPERFSDFNVQTDCLSKNYRSQKAIIDFNNQVFSIENLKQFCSLKEDHEVKTDARVILDEDDWVKWENIFGQAQQQSSEDKPDGFVRMEYIDADKKEDRDEITRERVLELISDLEQRFDLYDIAVLTRNNHQVEQVTSWLLQEGIKVESERTSHIARQGIILELISLLKFLHSPVDNIAFTEFIFGEIFQSVSGLSRETLNDFVFSLRPQLKGKNNFTIYQAFQEKYPELWKQYFDPFFKNVGIYPLYELVISIYHCYSLPETFSGLNGFLMHFLELIKNHEDEQTDIISFLEYFDHLQGNEPYVHLPTQNAVKVMTVHKAKGLEFPVVILPFLGMSIEPGHSAQDYKRSYILHPHDDGYQLIRLKKSYLGFSDELYFLYAQEYKKAFLSEINNVYVALTRPKFELYGFLPQKVGSQFNFARYLIPENFHESGKAVSYSRSRETEKNQTILNPSGYHDWISYLQDEYLAYDGLIQRQSRLIGEVRHYVMSKILNVSQEHIEEAVISGLKEAKHQIDIPFNENAIKEDCLKLCRAEHLKKFFSIENGIVLTEKEMITGNGHSKVIDRLIIKQDEVWIVDYKSSAEDQDNHVRQVNEYVQICRDYYNQKEVRGYIIYFDTMNVVEVTGTNG